MKDIDQLIESKVAELFGRKAKLIRKHISPAVGIKIVDDPSEGYSIDTDNGIISKLGGSPDVNADFIWPQYGQAPLTFLCQINLKHLTTYQSILPKSGVLLFFVANDDVDAGAELQTAVKVIYLPEEGLSTKSQNKEAAVHDGLAMTFYPHYTVPSYQEEAVAQLVEDFDLGDDLGELEAYISELTYGSDDFTKDHLLGDPNAIQGAVRIYWGAQHRHPEDTYYERMLDYLDEALAIGNDFILLLQIDLSTADISFPGYGDSCLYFGIHKDDLARQNFDNVKLVFQNT